MSPRGYRTKLRVLIRAIVGRRGQALVRALTLVAGPASDDYSLAGIFRSTDVLQGVIQKYVSNESLGNKSGGCRTRTQETSRADYEAARKQARAAAHGELNRDPDHPLTARVIVNRVHMHDLHGTMLHLLGIDHERLTFPYAGRGFRLTDVHGRVVREIIA